jgi:hypothetical protein
MPDRDADGLRESIQELGIVSVTGVQERAREKGKGYREKEGSGEDGTGRYSARSEVRIRTFIVS